jgi:alkylation response protein AidB-like acyl-CoA dehydrogenase
MRGERIADSRLGPRELEIRDRVREVVEDVIAPNAATVDATSSFPHEAVRRLGEDGLGGLLVPREFGGSGDSALAYVAAMEEIAAACGSTSTVYMTQMHCAYPILLAAGDDLRHRLLPRLCDCSSYGALGVTEPAAGSDVAALRTQARRDGEMYVLTGAKAFITNSDVASIIVVFATVDRAFGRDGITAFIVERGMPGLQVGPLLSKLGMRGSATGELYFDECRVPATHLLGGEGNGWPLLLRSVTKSRLSAAAQGVGLARGAYELALGWASGNGLLKGSRGYVQEVQFALADARTRIAQARSLLYDVAVLVDEPGVDAGAEVAMAKLACTDCAMGVGTDLVGLLGAEGDLIDVGLERYVRDAKITQIYDGTNQVQRLLVSRALAS